MPNSQPPAARKRLRVGLQLAATAAAATLSLTVLVRPTENAVANGDTRTLNMVNMHTGESISVTYKRGGQYDSAALKQVNWFLRDWRRNEPTRMDPRMLDTVWAAYRTVGASQPIHVVCGYRAPETNAMLRRRSRGVAKFSQHTLGKAMDFYIPGVNLASLRAAGLRLQRGGVGYYPTSGSPFVHMDAGSVRMWPRMSRAQLASIFPDGKTVHIPADGKPMAGYQQAFAELQRNGGSVGGFRGGGEDDAGAPASGGSIFGFGFGGGGSFKPANGKETPLSVLMASRRPAEPAAQPVVVAERQRPAPAPVPVAAPEPAPQPAPVVVAMAEPEPAPAPVTRAVPVPLPEPRPPELMARQQAEGPQLAWQTGPSGKPESDGADAVVAANVPLPPVRPGEDEPEDDASMQVAAADQPPLPPEVPRMLRPGAPVTADVAGSMAALIKNSERVQPNQALGFAAADAGFPPRTEAAEPSLVATRLDPKKLGPVLRPMSTARDPAQAGLVRPDLKTVATLIPAPSRVVVIRFGVAAYQDLRAERFTGAAIRPLQTARYATTPDVITGSLETPRSEIN